MRVELVMKRPNVGTLLLTRTGAKTKVLSSHLLPQISSIDLKISIPGGFGTQETGKECYEI